MCAASGTSLCTRSAVFCAPHDSPSFLCPTAAVNLGTELKVLRAQKSSLPLIGAVDTVGLDGQETTAARGLERTMHSEYVLWSATLSPMALLQNHAQHAHCPASLVRMALPMRVHLTTYSGQRLGWRMCKLLRHHSSMLCAALHS